MSREVFNSAMQYIAWHNRLQMTPIVTLPQAVCVAFALEETSLDALQYTAVKSFIARFIDAPPRSLQDCREAGRKLTSYLKGEAEN